MPLVYTLLFITYLDDASYHNSYSNFKSQLLPLSAGNLSLSVPCHCLASVIPKQLLTSIICHYFLFLFLTGVSQILVYTLVRIYVEVIILLQINEQIKTT